MIQVASNKDNTGLHMSLAHQILQQNLITHLPDKERALFVKIALLECLRQRIFITTETWSNWLKEATPVQEVDLVEWPLDR